MGKKNSYEGPVHYWPISPWGYLGYTILFLIPVVGLISLLTFTFSSDNINRRNFARSYWCALFTGAVAIAILMAAGVLPRFDRLIEMYNHLSTISWVSTAP
jgi:hypothetical protein